MAIGVIGSREADRGDDDVWDVVGVVEGLDCGSDGLGVDNFDAR